MSIVGDIIDPVLQFHGWPAYAVVGGLVFAQAAIFLAFACPSQAAVVVGGVLAYRGQVSLALILLAVIGCAVLGNTVGYEVGRRFGDRVLSSRLLRRHAAAIAVGREKVVQLGGRAVFVGRFGALLRAFTPVIAGTAGIAYRNFQWWNLIGGVVWGGGFTVLGYFAGSSYQALTGYAELFGWFLLVLVTAAVVVLVLRRRTMARSRTRRAAPPSKTAEKSLPTP